MTLDKKKLGTRIKDARKIKSEKTRKDMISKNHLNIAEENITDFIEYIKNSISISFGMHVKKCLIRS